MATAIEQLAKLTDEVADSATNLRESLTVSATVATILFKTQAMFLTYLKK